MEKERKTINKLLRGFNIKRLEDDPIQRAEIERYNQYQRKYKTKFEEITDKSHYIGQIQAKCLTEKITRDNQLCETKGHIDGIILSKQVMETFYRCERCGAGYSKPNSQEEIQQLYDNM